MSRSFNEYPVAATSSNKGLWAAIAVLGAALVAMGAFWAGVKTQPVESRAAAVPDVAPVALASATAPAPLASVPAATAPVAIITEMKDQPATKKAAAAAKPVAPQAAKAVPAAVAAPVPVAQAPAPVVVPALAPAAPPVVVKPCLQCGIITAVNAVQRDGPGSGLGAVAGGVLGGVLGNQVGGGDGKTIATILGAVGGGFAGNQMEKRMKKETIYEVQVRMEDGSARTLELANPVAVGARVTVEGSALRLADGSLTTSAARPAPVAPSAPTTPAY